MSATAEVLGGLFMAVDAVIAAGVTLILILVGVCGGLLIGGVLAAIFHSFAPLSLGILGGIVGFIFSVLINKDLI